MEIFPNPFDFKRDGAVIVVYRLRGVNLRRGANYFSDELAQKKNLKFFPTFKLRIIVLPCVKSFLIEPKVPKGYQNKFLDLLKK